MSDYEIKQAVGAVAKLGGWAIKKVTTADDLKERSLTIVITRSSPGWVQERLEFEDIPPQLATVDGNNGHVDKVETQLAPGDLAETEAEAEAEAEIAAAGTIKGVEPEAVELVAGVTPEPSKVHEDARRA